MSKESILAKHHIVTRLELNTVFLYYSLPPGFQKVLNSIQMISQILEEIFIMLRPQFEYGSSHHIVGQL